MSHILSSNFDIGVTVTQKATLTSVSNSVSQSSTELQRGSGKSQIISLPPFILKIAFSDVARDDETSLIALQKQYP